MKIIIDKNIPYIKGVFEPFADVVYLPGKDFTREDTKDADALIIRTRTICNEDLLAGSKVKVIASATIGFDHIDTEYCEKNNIFWTNAKGCNSRSVHQYVIAALLHLATKYKFDLKEKTLGIVGIGNIGSILKEFAETIGMKVVINDPPLERKGIEVDFKSYKELLEVADIITYHVPLNMTGEDKTFHLVGEDAIDKMKNGVFVINSSRGEVVDNEILLKYIKEGKFGGVVLDVWENEPAINKELLELVDLGTPHIAGYSADGKANGTQMSVNAVAKVLDLPLTDWKVENVPPPENKEITSASDGDVVDVLHELVPQTYAINSDSEKLKSDITSFELLRNTYPVRREFPAYVTNVKAKEDKLSKLEKIGFIC